MNAVVRFGSAKSDAKASLHTFEVLPPSNNNSYSALWVHGSPQETWSQVSKEAMNFTKSMWTACEVFMDSWNNGRSGNAVLVDSSWTPWKCVGECKVLGLSEAWSNQGLYTNVISFSLVKGLFKLKLSSKPLLFTSNKLMIQSLTGKAIREVHSLYVLPRYVRVSRSQSSMWNWL